MLYSTNLIYTTNPIITIYALFEIEHAAPRKKAVASFLDSVEKQQPAETTFWLNRFLSYLVQDHGREQMKKLIFLQFL
jgi:hypothetical protein